VGILIINLGRHTNCEYCFAVHLILKHRKKARGWEGSDTLFIQLTWNRL